MSSASQFEWKTRISFVQGGVWGGNRNLPRDRGLQSPVAGSWLGGRRSAILFGSSTRREWHLQDQLYLENIKRSVKTHDKCHSKLRRGSKDSNSHWNGSREWGIGGLEDWRMRLRLQDGAFDSHFAYCRESLDVIKTEQPTQQPGQEQKLPANPFVLLLLLLLLLHEWTNDIYARKPQLNGGSTYILYILVCLGGIHYPGRRFLFVIETRSS